MHRLARTPFPALHKTAADRLPALVDKGHIGAGIGILVPVRRPKDHSEQNLHADTRTTNNLIRGARALGERLRRRQRLVDSPARRPSCRSRDASRVHPASQQALTHGG